MASLALILREAAGFGFGFPLAACPILGTPDLSGTRFPLGDTAA